MNEILVIIGSILATLLTIITLQCYLFYTKSQVDTEISKSEDKLNKKITDLNKEITELKDSLYEKLDRNKATLESSMDKFIQMITEIKEVDRDLSVQFITMIDTVKDELKNDYSSRYTELLTLMNGKASKSEFDRLELKFDKISEVITEVKTIVQHNLNKQLDKNK